MCKTLEISEEKKNYQNNIDKQIDLEMFAGRLLIFNNSYYKLFFSFLSERSGRNLVLQRAHTLILI